MTSDPNANAAAGVNPSAPGIVNGPETASAASGDGPAKRIPVYKRRRRRNYAIVATVIVIVAGLSAWLATSGGGGATPDFTITTSQGAVANSDSIIESDSSLAKTIPAKLHFIPFDAGVTAVAEMRSGTVQSISGVGNPPTTEAIGDGTGITVVLAQSFDSDELLVPKSVTTPQQFAGKSVGVLVGSSEDYELRGWLGLEHLSGKVKLVELGSEQAVGAAYVAHAVDAAYVQGGYATEVESKGGHSITDAEQIAKLGVPGIDVVAVSTSLVKSNPQLVQKYVCAEVQATKLFTGPQGEKYLAQSAGVQGVPANEIIPATRAYPFIPLNQQLYWLGSTTNDTSSPIVKAYVQTGQFLVQQGRLQSVPSAATVATHIDPTFAKNALSGGC
jgi:NitT/TauT family transport system substrate-binding protein